MPRLVAISAGLSQPSSTRLLADALAESTARHLADDSIQVDAQVIELRPLARRIADQMVTGFPSGELTSAIESVLSADGLIAVTPVFAGSFSGLFKSFFDNLDVDALQGMPVLLGATAGSARHSLAIDHAMRPLFAYLRAAVVPTGVAAASEDFGSEGLAARVDRAGRELAQAMLLRPRSDRGSAASGEREAGFTDRFDEVVDFSELLRDR